MDKLQRERLRKMLDELDRMLDSGKLTKAQDVQVYEARKSVFYAIGTDIEPEEEYPFGIAGGCVVCGRSTSNLVYYDGEYVPVCKGRCTKEFKGVR